MSQGNGSFASGLKETEPDSKFPEVFSPAPGEQMGVVSAEDGESDSRKEDPVNEKKDVPHAPNPQLGPEPKAESSAGENRGDGAGQGSQQQHHAGDSGNVHGGREQTFSEDDIAEQVGKDIDAVPFDERAQTGADGGSSLSEHPVDEQGVDHEGSAPNATPPTNEVMGSGEDKTGQTSNVKEDKKSEHAHIEMGASQQAKAENAELDKSNVTRAAVKDEPVAHSSAGTVPFFLDLESFSGDGSGTQEEQALFMKELESFHKQRKLEFKPPKFYGGGLNCLKLWRAVIKLGGYDQDMYHHFSVVS